MENIGSFIEKIKIDEEEMITKLKLNRQNLATLDSTNRTIRDMLAKLAKLKQDEEALIEKTLNNQYELETGQLLLEATAAHIEGYNRKLSYLQALSNQSINQVWELRSSFCNTVQNISEACDVWALFMKPKFIAPCPQKTETPIQIEDITLKSELRFKNALVKRDNALKEREKLLNEPNTGREFVRIKNALRYSSEMVLNLSNSTYN